MQKNRFFIYILIIFISCLSLFFFKYLKNSQSIKKDYSKAKNLFLKGERVKTKSLFETIYKLNPGFEKTRFYLGKLHFYDKNFSRSFELFLEHWKDKKEFYALEWVIISGVYAKRNAVEIHAYIQIYLNHHPNNPEILYWKGFLEEKSGNLEDAIFSYKKSLEFSNQLIRPAQKLKNIYSKAGLSEKSREYQKIENFLNSIEFFDIRKTNKENL